MFEFVTNYSDLDLSSMIAASATRSNIKLLRILATECTCTSYTSQINSDDSYQQYEPVDRCNGATVSSWTEELNF